MSRSSRLSISGTDRAQVPGGFIGHFTSIKVSTGGSDYRWVCLYVSPRPEDLVLQHVFLLWVRCEILKQFVSYICTPCTKICYSFLVSITKVTVNNVITLILCTKTKEGREGLEYNIIRIKFYCNSFINSYSVRYLYSLL